MKNNIRLKKEKLIKNPFYNETLKVDFPTF